MNTLLINREVVTLTDDTELEGKVKFNINHITYQIIESLKNHFIQ